MGLSRSGRVCAAFFAAAILPVSACGGGSNPGGGKGPSTETGVPAGPPDVKVVATGGEDVADLAPHLAPGKVTIVDFSASWCEPCRVLDAYIMKTMRSRSDVAYRKLEIGDWDTPVSRHYLKDVTMLPFVIVFDKSGHEIERVSGVDVARLDAAIDRGADD